MMTGLGAVLEPLVVVSLLAGGTVINRNCSSSSADRFRYRWKSLAEIPDDAESSGKSSSEDDTTLCLDSPGWSPTSSVVSLSMLAEDQYMARRQRKLSIFGWEKVVNTPNTEVFKERLLSRLLRKYPFLVEVWYWALIYWVYQLGRAFTALTLSSSTVDVARKHALQVIRLEQSLHLFFELPIQQRLLAHPTLLHWTNRTYSFIHIPGTILFLILLFYVTSTRPGYKLCEAQAAGAPLPKLRVIIVQFRQETYRRRRRTMAMCNLLAFIVFTLWPCMPPRLLSDPEYMGPDAIEAKRFGFVDTVHGPEGESSVWTTNRFCNQYAAMPSLHFGYSFLIGLTIATLPSGRTSHWSFDRIATIAAGMSYPFIIFIAIVATANHFVLDAMAGACVCGLAWKFNGVLLNLMPLEDYILAALRIHKPEDPELEKEGHKGYD